MLTGSWEAGLKAVRRNGIGLEEQGICTCYSVDVLDLEKSPIKFHMAILLVKAYQTTKTLERLQNHLDITGTVLSLQNGLTVRSQMHKMLGEDRTISGITLCAAEQIEPGVVRHNGGSAVFIEEHHDAKAYSKAFSAAGFSVTISREIKKMIWEKAILNSAANPLGAILGLQNGRMAAMPDVMDIVDELIQEGCHVAETDGIILDPPSVQKKMRQILEDTSTNRCSMLQDVLHRRETEIEEINGAIVDLGKENGIPTPVQNTVRRLVRSIIREA